MNITPFCHTKPVPHRQGVSVAHIPPLENEGGQALDVLRETVQLYGADALHSARQRLETLQECFLSIVQTRLGSAGMIPIDKFSVCLGDDAKLHLHTAESDSHIRDLLTADNELETLFTQMHTLALTAQGLEHLYAAQDTPHKAPVRYRACFKGALSHFYLN